MAASSVASSQPARPCLASAWSSCRPMFGVKEVVSEASEMLRSSIPHAAVTSKAVGRQGIVMHRDVRLDGLLFLSWRSSTCHKRVTEVEEAFIGGVGASYVCVDYRLRPSRRAGCSRSLHPDIESEPTSSFGSAARQELEHGPDWPWDRVHAAGVPTTVGNGPAGHAYEVATSAEGSASRGGRSRPIVRQAPFHRVPVCEKELRTIRAQEARKRAIEASIQSANRGVSTAANPNAVHVHRTRNRFNLSQPTAPETHAPPARTHPSTHGTQDTFDCHNDERLGNPGVPRPQVPEGEAAVARQVEGIHYCRISPR